MMMEDFDLGVTDLLTQITDEEMREVEGVVWALTREPQETQSNRLSLSGKGKRSVYYEEPRRTVSIVVYYGLSGHD